MYKIKCHVYKYEEVFYMKKVLAVLLGLFMVVGSLTACKTKAPQTSNTKSNTTSVEEAGGGTDSSTVRVLKFNTNAFAAPSNVPGLKELFEKWEKENNAKLDITISVDDYLPKLLQDINAGNVADVAFVDGSNLSEVDQTGAMVPLDKWFTPDMQKEHYPYAIDGARIDGKIKAVWFHGGLWNLYYRKDLLEQAGYKEPPKDWDELIEIGKKLTVDEDGDGVIDRYGLGIPGFPDAVTVCSLLPWYWGHGDDVNLTNGKDKITFGEGKDFDAMLDSMKFLQNLIKEGVVAEDLASTKFTDVEANFVGNQTAMAILGNWHYPLMKDSGGDEFMSKIGIADIPAVPGQKSVTTAGGWSIAMFTQDPEQQELAWSFMNFYRSAEVQTLLSRIGQMSSLLEIYEQPEFADDPMWQAFSKGLYGGRTRDGVPFYSAADEAFKELVQSAVIGEENMGDAIKKAAKKAQKSADSIIQ